MITMQMVCAVTSQQGRYHVTMQMGCAVMQMGCEGYHGTMQMGCAVTSQQSKFLHREIILSRLLTSPS